MIKIKLTQEAYANNGSVHIGVSELKEWYEAQAEDADGNTYRVIWSILDDYNEEQGEDSACNWSTPWVVLDEHYKDISDNVKIV